MTRGNQSQAPALRRSPGGARTGSAAGATLHGRHATLLPMLSTLSVLVVFVAIQVAARLSAGAFEYPLDDVYIHLAMAEQIAAGGYGVNAGEYASAASSPVYPLLLLPIFGPDVQRLQPLLWNTVALAACGWLWGMILAKVGYCERQRLFGLLAAIVVPVLVNLPGVAFAGMEHTLHTAASLAIVFGLLRLLDDDVVSPLLIAGIVFGPALRFEGIALSLLASGVLVVRGRPLAGGLAGAGAVAMIAAFMTFLLALGLDPLPSSVQTKLATADDGSFLVGLVRNVIFAAHHPNGRILLAALAAAIMIITFTPGLKASPRVWLARVLFLALAAQILVGRFGWLDRYENYVLVASVAGLLAIVAGAGPRLRAVALVPALVAGLVYLPHMARLYPGNARTIYLQQAQMARLARDFEVGPVAVNDLGWVAWNNQNYVLDLWGLGYPEALHLRLSNAEPGWAAPLAERHGVTLAMIYDDWLGDAVGAGWVRLGTLEWDVKMYFGGDPSVTFYATSEAAAEALRPKIFAWEAGLPDGSRFEFFGDATQ